MAPVLEALDEYSRTLGISGASHPVLGCATLNVGTIRGGTGVNIVPDSCEIHIDRRLLPGEDPAEALNACRAFLLPRLGKDFPVVFDPPWHSEPALDTPLDSAVVKSVTAAASAVLGGARTCGVPYGTDAATLSAGGIPSVVFGPGDIAQAHTDDEWIETKQIELAAEAYYRVLLAAG
jgi:acetylornithine deacetylase